VRLFELILEFAAILKVAASCGALLGEGTKGREKPPRMEDKPGSAGEAQVARGAQACTRAQSSRNPLRGR
jgi:hypothetical protein